MKRRSFLKKAVAAALPAFVPACVFAANGSPGANERVRVGVAGLGRRANWMLQTDDFSGAQIVAVADAWFSRCDKTVAQSAAKRPALKPETWKKYPDIRRMLDGEKLDAVFVETTTHARVWCMMHALAAGCDVYGEKPLTLTIEEGRRLSDAARKLGRIFQTGTQQRSMPTNAYASRLVREGAIGKVKEAVVYNFEGPLLWVPRPAQPVPPDIDWDLWTNQAPLRPYHQSLADINFDTGDFRYWPFYEDYDGGGWNWGVTGYGTHALDQVQCALGTDDTGPVEVWLEGKGKNGWPKVTLRYGSGTLLKLTGERHTAEDLGAIFRGEKGNIEILRGHARATPPELLRDAPPNTPNITTPHIANFLHCVRTRERPSADAEIGHRSTTVCHLINVCRKLGRKLQWDPKAERFVGDDEANRMLSRPRRKGYELPQIT